MTPLSGVPSPADEPTGIPARGLASVDDDGAVDDWSAAHRPDTDPEALLLSALMWSNHPGGPTTETRRIVGTVTTTDFDSATYARLYEVIAALVAAGEQHDPASVTHALARAGSSGPTGDSLRHRLTGVATAGDMPPPLPTTPTWCSPRPTGAATAQSASPSPRHPTSSPRSICSTTWSSTVARNAHCGTVSTLFAVNDDHTRHRHELHAVTPDRCVPKLTWQRVHLPDRFRCYVYGEWPAVLTGRICRVDAC